MRLTAARRPLPAAPAAAPAARPAAVATERPSVVGTWARLLSSLFTGETVYLPGKVQPYPAPTPAEKAAAVALGQGRTVAQGFLAGDRAGTELEEPVNLIVKGSRADLEQALTSRGWVVANPRGFWNFVKAGASALLHLGHEPQAPVSEQFLYGRSETLAFNKDSDFNLSRDHMRVYHQGVDPATGLDVWAIAATRDTHLEVAFPRTGPWPWQWKGPAIGHQVDTAIDAERDLIMHDLLASGRVRTWAAVAGQRPAGLEGRPLPNGQLQVHKYRTDGRVYEVTLG